MRHPLYVAFLWHMHQPYYRDASTGEFSLPWTRLHATKDYLHMAELLAAYPSIHATINVVPSLIEQLQDYAGGVTMDRALRVSLKESLSAADKQYLLSFFFSINWERVVNRYPAYRELLRQRQEARDDWRRFPDQYWTDLIVWFNLAWFDPGHIQRDEELKALADKARGFSYGDVRVVVEKSRNVAAPTLAAYRDLAQRGQVEFCTSPYYHPILPLLVDTASAREATPGLSLPPTDFAYSEDALEQVRRAILSHEKTFGRTPNGMWPSEGAVSQGVANLIARNTDLAWIASDEAILSRSLGTAVQRDEYGHVTNPRLLYQPYAVATYNSGPTRPLTMIFRDRVLSDRVGFVYQHMSARDGAADLVHRLHRVLDYLGDTDEPYLVPIVLDGENCWEYYENNGDDFLRQLYGSLSDAAELQTVTISEYLAQFPPRAHIDRLSAGSWIGGDMLTWIGEPAQNEAWDALARTRQALVERAADDQAAALDVIGHAWQELYIAEGSDWFWWYSSRNNPNGDVFDAQFRGHLAEVYRNLGLPTPEWLNRPIAVNRPQRREHSPAGMISPDLTASAQAGAAWASAGWLEPDLSSATMQRADALLRRLYYGHDVRRIYLRVEAGLVGPSESVVVYLSTPRGRANRIGRFLPAGESLSGEGHGWSHELKLNLPARLATLSRADGLEAWHSVDSQLATAFDTIVAEVSVPLVELGLRAGDQVKLAIALGHDGAIEERYPPSGALTFRIARQQD